MGGGKSPPPSTEGRQAWQAESVSLKWFWASQEVELEIVHLALGPVILPM